MVPLILIFGNMEQRSSLRPDRFTPQPGITSPVLFKEEAGSDLVWSLWRRENLLFLQN